MDEKEIKLSCVDLASRIIVLDDSGERRLTKDDILEAAKAFYEFINAA